MAFNEGGPTEPGLNPTNSVSISTMTHTGRYLGDRVMMHTDAEIQVKFLLGQRTNMLPKEMTLKPQGMGATEL